MLILPSTRPELAAGTRGNEDSLQGLGFLVGGYWLTQQKGLIIVESFSWAPHGVFLTSEQTVLLDGDTLVVTGGIGWMAEDPATQKLRIWKFAADSSLAEGTQDTILSDPPKDPYWAFSVNDGTSDLLIVLIKNDENTLTVESRRATNGGYGEPLRLVYKRQPPMAS